MNERSLAEFGRWWFCAGWIFAAFFATWAERYDWPWWLVLTVGLGGFQLMHFLTGRLAMRAVAKAGERAS